MTLTFICPEGHYIEAEMERYFGEKKLIWCRYCWALISKSKCEVRNMKISKDKFRTGEQIPFFKAKDMKANTTTLKILNYREIDLPTGLTPVVDFQYNKQDRSLPLNQTNLGRLIDLFGEETDRWIGESMTLIKVMVTNPKLNKEVEGIRVKI